MSQDIRRWFAKKPEKSAGNVNAQKPLEQGMHGCSSRKKTSKYFVADQKCVTNESELEEASARIKQDLVSDLKPSPQKRLPKNEDEDIATPISRKGRSATYPKKKLKTPSGKGVSQDVTSESDEEDPGLQEIPSTKFTGRGRGTGTIAKNSSQPQSGGKDKFADESNVDDDTKPFKPGGRGRGAPASGRGRGGGGRGGFMNFGERKDPPHKGEKEIPEGSPNCLDGLTFVISGTLDSLEREEAEDLIKRHGGRVTGSVSKKTNYLLCDEDIGGRKSSKAKELGTNFLTEDGLFEMIQSSNKSKASAQNSKILVENSVKTSPKNTRQMPGKLGSDSKGLASSAGAHQNNEHTNPNLLPWTEKYRPKVPNDIVGNQTLVKQLHDWLKNWNEQNLNIEKKGKGRKQNDSVSKKAVLLSGTPGIGKTTAAKLVSQMLGFRTIEVNASDSRGKADAKISKGIGGSTSNLVKELVSNEGLSLEIQRSQHPKAVLIMDEVDGMSAGDRGGIADLIASIKVSKIPIICICNDRYSQKIKSLVNYCMAFNFRKPTKQQIAKRLSQIASAEGLQVNEIALEELSEKVNGDIRLAINELQYMSLSMSVIKFDDIKERLQRNSKDEDISPFTAVDKLFGFHGAKLRMDERIELSMSDPDLVPLLIQENYVNYRPVTAVKDDSGVKRIQLAAMAAESIGDGDIVNVQIRRYQRWQLSQIGSLTSCIIPAALLHGQREVFEQGERNFNRFGGWLGKNSTMGKNYRLLEDLHVHLLSSRESNLGRATLRLDYLTLLLKQMSGPLKELPKDEAVGQVIEFMDLYSISMEDLDTVVELSKFKGYPDPLAGIQPAVKAALTRAYNKGSSSRLIRAADLVTLPGAKKALQKRVAVMLEPLAESETPLNENMENGEETASETEQEDDSSDSEKNQLQSDLEKLNSKGIKVEMNLKAADAKKTPSSRGKRSAPPTSDVKPKAPKSVAKRKKVT